MIGKIILFPFWLIKTILGSGIGIIRFALGFLFGIFRFIFGHLLGSIFGFVVGLLLGKKHLGIKIFTGKKKVKAKAEE